MSKNEKYGSFPEYIVHIIGWGVIFLFPLFFNSNREDEPFNFIEYVRHSIVPGAFCLVFYINYLLLVPRYMFRGKFMAFIVINSVIIMIFCAMTQIFSSSPVGCAWATGINPSPRAPARHKLPILLTVAFFLAMCHPSVFQCFSSVKKSYSASIAHAGVLFYQCSVRSM